MTGEELRAIRQKLELDLASFGRALGYMGSRETLRVQINGYENGRRPIPPWIANLTWMYGKHGIPRHIAKTLRDDVKTSAPRPPLPDWKPDWEKPRKNQGT